MMDTPAVPLSKVQRWDQTSEKFLCVTDRLGMPIDAGILEAVVALNVLGIRTSGSCEGHLDRGTFAPYIHFHSFWLAEDDQRAIDRLDEAVEQRELKRLSSEEIERLFEDARQLRDEVRRNHALAMSALMPYLSTFYARRVVSYEQRLYLCDGQGILSMLENQGAQFQAGVSPEHRQEKLVEYQQEMQAFGTFLKQCYFSEENDAASYE